MNQGLTICYRTTSNTSLHDQSHQKAKVFALNYPQLW